MHRKIIILGAWALILAGTAPVRAQLTSTGPVEIFSCNYTESGSYAGFMNVVADWQEWMDEHGIDSYTGIALTPYYYGESLDLDLVWLGAWPSSTDEGIHMGAWIRDGRDINAAFGEIVDCRQHARYFGGFLKTFSSPADSGLRQFRNCKLLENRTTDDAMAAIGEWLEFGADLGSDNAHAVLFPLEGESTDADYDFKWMVGFTSAESYGRIGDAVVQAGGGARFAQIFGSVMQCDSPRTYAASVERRSN